MEIAFIGHSYHRQTGSSGFFIDLLKKIGQVQVYYDDSWRGEPSPWINDFNPARFDCIVVWQVAKALEFLREPHPNIVYVPMYDALLWQGRVQWDRAVPPAKILCFSSELNREVSRYTDRTAYFQYFPDPDQYPTPNFGKSLRGFFWNRVPAINENVIAALCGATVFDHFGLHDAVDPRSGAKQTHGTSIASRTTERGGWKKNRKDYLKQVARHNVFFAPRPCEGIGMGVLEAMAMGLCVVATDMPTHNEYIRDGRNGILYDLANPRQVTFSNVAELGARARESVEKGFRRWAAREDELLSFVSFPIGAYDSMLRRCSA